MRVSYISFSCLGITSIPRSHIIANERVACWFQKIKIQTLYFQIALLDRLQISPNTIL